MQTREQKTERILLTEDDTILGDWLQRRLESFGLHCYWAKTFLEAEKILKQKSFDAVVTDIFLEDGHRYGLNLVQISESLGIPVVVISSHADFSSAKEALNRGANYLMEKPFKAEDLKAVLDQIWESPKGLSGLVERFVHIHSLTSKEKEIVRLILKGLSNQDIASVLGNTEKTIKHHISVIFEKCGVHSRTELINCILPT